MVVTFAPMLVVPPTLVVTLTTVGPTTPAKVVAPVVFTARVKAPFTVEFREMAAPPELVSAVAAVRLTASLKVWAPVVVTFAPMLVVPPTSVVTLTTVGPTTPAKVVAPVVFTARVKAPFTVELREMARLPVLVSVVLPVSATALL